MNRIPLCSWISVLIGLAWVSLADVGAYVVVISSALHTPNYQSDGSPLDTTFQFQLGTFSAGFVPDQTNTHLWDQHWVVMTTPTGEEVLEATADYRMIQDVFGNPSEGFTASIRIDHNNAPFIAGETLYIWGYDVREGDAEWVLLTGDDSRPWRVKDDSTIQFNETYDPAGAQAIFGSLDGFSIRTASLPVPVPEPSISFLLVGSGLYLCAGRRRRRVAAGM